MKLRIKIALLGLLLASAFMSAAGAARSLKPPSLRRLPRQIYAEFGKNADSACCYLKNNNGYVTVYSDGKFRSALKVTSIETGNLRSADRAMLEKGIPVSSKTQLLQLLEDLGS